SRPATLAVAATAAPTPAASRPHLATTGAGRTLGLDALWPEPEPAERGLAAGQRHRRCAGDGRVRAGHFTGDAAADLVRRAHEPLAATPRSSHDAGRPGPRRGPADHRRAMADAGTSPARRAQRAGLPADFIALTAD